MSLSEIKEYIEKCKREKVYIYKINEIVSNNTITIDECNNLLKDIYLYNSSLYKLEQKRSKELKKIEQMKHENNEVQENNSTISAVCLDEYEEERENKIKEVDISFYLDQILDCKNFDDIEYFLPSPSSDDFLDIINSLLLYLKHEMIEMKRLLFSEQENMDKQELEDFKDELNDLKLYFDAISDYAKNSNKIIKEQSNEFIPKNKVVYLQRNNGENTFISRLDKDIDQEYYTEVAILLNSIIDGTFKNVKNFRGRSLSQVRLNQSRIIFRRLNKDTIVILDMFIKKCDWSVVYHNNLDNKILEFEQQRPLLLDLIKDDEYLKEQAEATRNIFDYLEKGKRKGKK